MTTDSFTVGDLTERLNVTDQTVRSWAKEFERHLEPRANPAPGEVRRFSPTDLQKLTLVASLRAEKAKADAIHASLDAGEWEQMALEETAPGAELVRYELEIARWQGRLAEVEKQRDQHLQELREERSRYAQMLVDTQRLDMLEQEAASLRERVSELTLQEREAFERAIRAEAELEVLKRPTEPPAAAQSALERANDRWTVVEEPAKPKRWWKRFFG